MPSFTVGELAQIVSGTVEGDPDRAISGVAPVSEAAPGELTFAVNASYARQLAAARPGAVLAPQGLELPLEDVSVIRVPDPQAAFSRLLSLLEPEPAPEPGIAPTAVVGTDVELGREVSIGAYAVVEDGARIGDRTRIGPFTYVQAGARIGADCRIGDSCTVLRRSRLGDRVHLHPGARVGTEGYGYSQRDGAAQKIPQVGRCVLEDDVEIGANCTVDRGSLGDTVVGKGTKVDNLVHIGHNVEIGSGCMIVAQVGIAGSSRIGAGAQLGGQAGIAGHLTIGAGARIAAQAGVIGDVPAGATYSGYPARPHRKALKASASLFRLPELIRRIRALEDRIGSPADAWSDQGR